MKDNSFLETQDIKSLFLKLVIPSVIAQIVNLMYNIVDRIYIGHIDKVGSLALTGVGLCMPIILILSAFGSLIGIGASPRMSLFMGKKKNDTAEEILGCCIFFIIILSIILTLIFRIHSEVMLMLFGASKNTLPYSLDYINSYILGTIFVITATSLNQFITSQGYTKVSMLIVVSSALANIILDPIFIFVLDMGVRGAAIATILSQALSSVLCFLFLTSSKSVLKIKLKNLRMNFELLYPCLLLGASPFVMQVTECVISICFNRNLFLFGGDIAVGSMTIFSTIMQFAVFPLQGFAQGAQPIVSYNFGADNLSRVSKALKLLLIVSTIYSTSMWIIIMFFPKIFINLFTDNPQLVDFCCVYIKYFFLMLFIMGPQIALQNSFLALGNASTSLFLAIWRKIILLTPLIFILPLFFTDNIMGVFLAEAVADTIASITTSCSFIIYFRKINKNNKLQIFKAI